MKKQGERAVVTEGADHDASIRSVRSISPWFKFILFFFLLPIIANAQVIDTKTFVESTVAISKDKIAAGDTVEVIVTAKIKAGIHLQAHKPSEDYLIKTELKLEPADGLTFSEVQYPVPKTVKFEFSDNPLLVYEGAIQLKFTVRIAANAVEGAREIRGKLRYQGCDDRQCYSPATVEIKVPITIVAGAKAQREGETSVGEQSSAATAKPATVEATKSVAAQPAISKIKWKPYTPELLEEAKKAGKIVIMDFGAEWCLPCKEMEATTFLDVRVIAESEKFVMVKVDLTSDEDPVVDALKREYQIVGVPTTIHRDAKGNEWLREVGYIGAEEFVAQMQATLRGEKWVGGGFVERLARSLEEAVNGKQFWLALVFCFLGGLALNLTPCVFPMIAITVSVFGGQERKSTAEAFGYALAYFFGVVITYTTLGLVTAATGAVFGALLQQPLVLILIALILVALSLSMFGLYEFQPPQFLIQRASGLGAKAGHIGTFFLGATMGIIAAPCVGPFLVALLLLVGKMGDLLRGGLMFFALSVGLALPYLILGTYSSLISKLPKSGAWMKWVKMVFGIALLALAFYFVSPLLK